VAMASDSGQHVAGGGGGKECAARHERSNDWPQGGAAPITRIKCARTNN
jgi:hypothetical protein